MRIRGPVSFVLSAIVLAAGCRSAAPSRPSTARPEVAGTSWTVREIEGQPTLTSSPPKVEFTADAAAGSTGCNSFRAPVERRDGTLSFGPTAVTKRACAPAVMEQETRFLSALAAVQSYRRDGAGLLLEGDGGRPLLRLVEASAAVPRG